MSKEGKWVKPNTTHIGDRMNIKTSKNKILYRQVYTAASSEEAYVTGDGTRIEYVWEGAGNPPSKEESDLRDHFAGMAIQGLLVAGWGEHRTRIELAQEAYGIADAMVEQSKK